MDDNNSTYLAIEQEVDGVQMVSVYQVRTSRALRINMYGEFEQIIQDNRVIVRVAPDTSSTIAVSDASTGDPLHLAAELAITDAIRDLRNGTRHMDLDSGELTASGH